ncbi:hypothetical protein [Sphingomonas sp. BK580]|uniref:hypothetical protein n=1 Tax=Sphingomonas sp. BK580 TaxID=2586972 RepID=UPI0016178A9F|nr:hypothetical protein [Sphingomonas sp. BK580]MBB3695230.1 hypothetical protein [Sphingomonas sp. BK580]
MGKKRSQEDIETEFRLWLEDGGVVEIQSRMARAQRTSDEFARSTRVRTETLYEPVAF